MKDDDRIVQLIPGGGWMIHYHFAEAGQPDIVQNAPVVAWALDAGGAARALDVSSDGIVDEVSGDFALWHPNSTWQRCERCRTREMAL